MALVLHEDARNQGRSEEEILGDFARIGRAQSLREGDLEARWDTLTRREREVLALLCMGHSNDEIGMILGIASATVKSHLNNIYYKFDVHTRQQLRSAMKDWGFEEWWQAGHK